MDGVGLQKVLCFKACLMLMLVSAQIQHHVFVKIVDKDPTEHTCHSLC